MGDSNENKSIVRQKTSLEKLQESLAAEELKRQQAELEAMMAPPIDPTKKSDGDIKTISDPEKLKSRRPSSQPATTPRHDNRSMDRGE